MSDESPLLTAYTMIGGVCGLIAFVGVWIAAVSSAGWVVGIALGWIPAMIAAILAALLGPAALLLAALALALVVIYG